MKTVIIRKNDEGNRKLVCTEPITKDDWKFVDEVKLNSNWADKLNKALEYTSEIFAIPDRRFSAGYRFEDWMGKRIDHPLFATE